MSGNRHRAVGGERHHIRRRACGWRHRERRSVELVVGGDIEGLLGVVVEHLGDDFLHRVRRQVVLGRAGLGCRLAVGHRLEARALLLGCYVSQQTRLTKRKA